MEHGEILTTYEQFFSQSQTLPPIRKDIHLNPQNVEDIATGISGKKQNSVAEPSFDNVETLKSEIVRLQHSLIVEKRGRSTKTVSGSQFRLPSKDAVRCEQCEQNDKLVKKMKEIIRSQKLQITHLEENVFDLRKGKSDEGKGDETAALIESNRATIKKCDHLQNEIHELRRRATEAEQRQKISDTSHLLSLREIDSQKIEIAELKLSLSKCCSQRDSFEQLFGNSKTQIDRLERLMREMNKISQDKKTQQSELQDEELRRLRDELATRSAEVTHAVRETREARELVNQKTGELVAAELSRDHLKALLDDSREKLGAAALAAQETVNRLRDSEDNLAQCLRDLEAAREQARLVADRREADAARLGTEAQSLRKDRAALQEALSEAARREAATNETTQAALEKAITSSVRLCVVAPTVNVHVGDRNLKFKSGVPEEALREFITSEVLMKYNFLFKQRQENSSPDEAQSIQVWVQMMLERMQSVIEQHVHSATSGPS